MEEVNTNISVRKTIGRLWYQQRDTDGAKEVGPLVGRLPSRGIWEPCQGKGSRDETGSIG